VAAEEDALRSLCASGDTRAAATRAVSVYGAEIMSYLASSLRDEQEVREGFSIFLLSMWEGLERFRWDCSFRTWAYAVARRSSLRFRRDARRRRARLAPMPESSRISGIAAEVRTETQPFLRTDGKNRFAALRATLPPEEQALLMLRVDRQLAWTELAQVLHDDEVAPLEGDALKREAARLRKRFQMVKEKLYEMGRREGLVPGEGE